MLMWNVIEYDQFMGATLIFNVYIPFRYLRESFNVLCMSASSKLLLKALIFCPSH